MKKALLALVTAIVPSVCFGQQITKDGFGSLHWGASIAEAEKAFPGCGKQDPLKLGIADRRGNS